MADKEKKESFRTMIGGQALIEGILMRGPERQAVVVRDKDGQLVEKVEELHLIKERHPVLGWPFIRGVVNFVDSLVKGMQALMYSADFYPDDGEAEEPSKFEKWLEKTFGSKKLESFVVTFAVFLGILVSLVLFVILPTLLGTAVTFVTDSMLARNVAEGVLRVVILILYMIVCSKTKDIKRVFQYHGAEHKTIFCYERGLDLTVDNVRDMPRHHPRCGTSFLFVVVIVSIIVCSIVFSLFQVHTVPLRILYHLLLLPIIVGITYEFNRYAGGHDNPLTNVLVKPGLWLQNFTTFEPDDSMIECAIAAMKLVIPEKKGQDKW